VLQVFCPVICVATTFKNSFWGETLQLLPVFKVICPFICFAGTFTNSFWALTVENSVQSRFPKL